MFDLQCTIACLNKRVWFIFHLQLRKMDIFFILKEYLPSYSLKQQKIESFQDPHQC
jgi:hypothetical protein